MPRLFAPLALGLALSLVAASAYAGPAETAFLSKFAGAWSGGGQVTGEDAGPLTCKLTVKPGTEGLSFSGRCDAAALGAQSFTGALAYNDATRRYEARSPGNATAVGTRKGSSLVFTTKLKSIAGAGNSTMTLTPSRITIDFTLARGQSGKTSKSHLVFTK